MAAVKAIESVVVHNGRFRIGKLSK